MEHTSIGLAVTSDPHPTLSITAFATNFRESVGMAATPARLLELSSPDAPAPFGSLASINLAVDACNAVSLHSGFPISVIDIERAHAPFRIAIAAPGARYVFNASGQEIDLASLLEEAGATTEDLVVS